MLSDFYKSKEWVDLLQILRMERVRDDGQLYCVFCGEPIVKKYDCIGHHVIPLTEQNYIDVSISLNPVNVQFVHHRCHNKIHDKLAHGWDRRQVYLVYGAPLSGKTSWVDDVKSEGDLIVDIDSIWECVSGCDRYVKPARLNGVVFGIRDYLIDSVRVRRGKWNNAYIIGGYPLISERERLCKTLDAREIFIDASREECLRRLQECNDRDVKTWSNYIDEWFERFVK